MFNLKRVYATISFEKHFIKVLVLENTIDKKINCLYYDYEKLDYLNEDLTFKNINHLKNSLIKLIKNVDEFMGMNVKRYIINISCLSIKSIKGVSQKYLAFGTITNNLYNNYVDKVKIMLCSNNEYSFNIVPTKWFVDNKPFDAFPESEYGKTIHYEFTALVANQKIVNQFIDVLNSIKITALKITCNSLCLGDIIENYGIDSLIVDVKVNKTNINIYDKNKKIKAIVNLQFGSNWYVENIRKLLKLERQEQVYDVVNTLTNLNLSNNQEASLINIHTKNFLQYKDITNYGISNVLKIVNKLFIEKITPIILSLRVKLKSNFNKIIFNTNDELHDIFNIACRKALDNGMIIENIDNNIIGLESCAINNMLASVKYVYREQTSLYDHHLYSVDPYTQSNVSLNQMRKGLAIKLGIISTNFAAKLGE